MSDPELRGMVTAGYLTADRHRRPRARGGDGPVGRGCLGLPWPPATEPGWMPDRGCRRVRRPRQCRRLGRLCVRLSRVARRSHSLHRSVTPRKLRVVNPTTDSPIGYAVAPDGVGDEHGASRRDAHPWSAGPDRRAYGWSGRYPPRTGRRGRDARTRGGGEPRQRTAKCGRGRVPRCQGTEELPGASGQELSVPRSGTGIRRIYRRHCPGRIGAFDRVPRRVPPQVQRSGAVAGSGA